MQKRQFNRAPAMRDVAQAAGVSAQTVSRVLSDHPNVQEVTKRRVLAAVEELGYRRNNTARALVTGLSRTIGVVTLATNNYSRSSLALGVELAAREAGYAVNSVTSNLSTQGLTEAVSRLVQQGVDGLIIAAPLQEAARRVREITARIPTVTTDGSSGMSDELVGVDQESAVVLATNHLLGLGHRTVWHVSGPPEWSDAASRLDSWRRALEKAGREVPPELHGDWSPESGYRSGLILGRMPDVTAILVASDEMAFGVIRALTELGRRIPEDVSVVGIDDIDLAAYATPPLTTVRQSFEDTGRRAVFHLLEQIENPEAEHTHQVVEPTLVIRKSTAPPPSV
ncbi:LacI family DNA-binding transcriptional regulator [Arthrobacter sp. 35W]|uniref:LacI family DNA-binding transcriptional regulator n=1 Tax=Arthrobacter sp. 35W TaxID=1132441 RepID=UPI0004145F1F|nr:LacI family DNA-binding transcriptional regulator [Arthrobacter sp. 35W]